MMQTAVKLDDPFEKPIELAEAAAHLCMHEETLRRKANRGVVPGSYTGKWLFFRSQLNEWLLRQQPQAKNEEVVPCQSTGLKTKTAQKLPTSTSPSRAASDCEKALGLNRPTKMRKGSLRSITTNVESSSGGKQNSETSHGEHGMKQS